MQMPGRSESAEHRELKRLALTWAQENGYRIASAEVSLPQCRFRLDVAAYRPLRVRAGVRDDGRGGQDSARQPAVGITAVFECKASQPDFRKDARSIVLTNGELKTLHERKTRIEHELRLFYPSIRNGDSLFQEYETLDFGRPGHERYRRTLDEIGRLTSRLHANTKFDKLVKWGAANLFYVVAEPGTVEVHELPAGWGLLVRENSVLCPVARPVMHDIGERERLSLLQRISMAGTRAVNREHGVVLGDVRSPLGNHGC